MYAKKIIHSDEFMDLSDKAKLLFFELNIEADDDGFVTNSTIPKMIARASDDDLQELLKAGFFYKFPSGVLVELCWKVGNQIRKDRYRKTDYQSEFKQLFVDDNFIYKLRNTGTTVNDTSKNEDSSNAGIPSGNQMVTNTDTTGKGKAREVKGIEGKLGEVKPSECKTRKESAERKPNPATSELDIKDYEKLDQMSDEEIKTLLLKNNNSIKDFFNWLEESTGLDQQQFSKDFQDRTLNCFRNNVMRRNKQKKA